MQQEIRNLLIELFNHHGLQLKLRGYEEEWTRHSRAIETSAEQVQEIIATSFRELEKRACCYRRGSGGR